MELKYLAGKIALGDAYLKDYTDWAESMLVKGTESENVAILAGLGLDKGLIQKRLNTTSIEALETSGLNFQQKKVVF